MTRLTMARKFAPIVGIVWKRGVCFDALPLKPQTAGVFLSESAPSWRSSLAVAVGFSRHSGSRASLSDKSWRAQRERSRG
jgi:hypothetical protein